MKIYAISYGEYKGCYQDKYVIPIQAGSSKVDTDKIEVKDNSIDNISYKNEIYNELTAIYSIWKDVSLQDNLIGICHYRRYFVKANPLEFIFLRFLRKIKGFKNIKRKIYSNVLSRTSSFLQRESQNVDVILPRKLYFSLTLQQHYNHYHSSVHYDAMMMVIEKNFPYLYDTATHCSKLSSGYFFNMSIMKQCFFNDYCNELFKFTNLVEAEIQKNTNVDKLRYIGYLSERFSNFYFHYLIENKKIKFIEIDVMLIQNEVYV